MEVFKDYAKYYNAFYKDKDYAKEAADVDSLLKTYGTNISDIIIYGCGTGKHDREFARLGYHCHGIDMSGQMVVEAKKGARQSGLEISYEVSDIREYVPNRKYDAVLSLFHVMSYQTSNQDILDAFHSARSCLDKDGLFLFDAWYGPGVLSDPPEVRIKESKIDNLRLVRLCTPETHANTNVVDVNYDLLVINDEDGKAREIQETHNMRYFFTPEIREYLKLSRFELIETLDCANLKNAGFSSWTSYFVARAI